MTITAAIVLTGVVFGPIGMLGFLVADEMESYKAAVRVSGTLVTLAVLCFLTAIWYEALS